MKLKPENVFTEFEEKEMAESENFDIVGVSLSDFELTGDQVKLLPELWGMIFRKLDSHDLRQKSISQHLHGFCIFFPFGVGSNPVVHQHFFLIIFYIFNVFLVKFCVFIKDL